MGVLIMLYLHNLNKMKSKRKKRFWMKKIYQKRLEYTQVHNIMTDLNVLDFNSYLRLDFELLEMLLQMVGPKIKRQNTKMRDSVSVKERLVVTLRYLATGESYRELMTSNVISPQLLSEIIPETCLAIYLALKDEYLKFPASSMEWKKIATDFENKWQFPHCIGAMDGKHVRIIKPRNSGSVYYNYKKYFSVILFAIVNANCEFIYVYAGMNGRAADAGVLKNTTFYERLLNENLNLPEDDILPNSTVTAPYVVIGDSGFPLLGNLIVPYSRHSENSYNNRIFNYRLSRARRVSENAFGILAARFRLFYNPIAIDVDYLDHVILACCALHNFLINMKIGDDLPETLVSRENVMTGSVTRGDYHEFYRFLDYDEKLVYSHEEGITVREGLKRYFNEEGRVGFQDRMIS